MARTSVSSGRAPEWIRARSAAGRHTMERAKQRQHGAEMTRRRTRMSERRGAWHLRNRTVVITLGLIVTLAAAGAIMAANGVRWFAPNSLAPTPQAGGPMAPANPSKEYIYAAGR